MVSSIPIEYKKILNRSIWLIDRTLTGTTSPGQSGPESNSTLPRTSELELHYQMQFSVTYSTH